MSIPLDRLYHYIENIAKEVRGDDVLIYRFFPHGSKKIEDLGSLSESRDTFENIYLNANIYCYDQEPLDYARYIGGYEKIPGQLKRKKDFIDHGLELPDYNLRTGYGNMYDYSILVHSEQRSEEVKKYQSNFFIPVYYWSHAIIARDWFRYAEHQLQTKHSNLQEFLIYNRAWSGTREYRIKFVDLLIDYNLINSCKTSFNPVDPETQLEYTQHNFLNSQWAPTNQLENYFEPTSASACCSADFVLDDYNATRFEIVLETLFDDSRVHLTEKSLRPIACGQPFLLIATHGSLEYLRSYGFQTFDSIIDESYDSISDPYQRLIAVVKEMQRLSSMTESEKQKNSIKLQQITTHNQQHFFSKNFSDLIHQELSQNFRSAFDTLENKNTCENFFSLRKKFASIPPQKQELLSDSSVRTRKQLIDLVKKARQYYKKKCNK